MFQPIEMVRVCVCVGTCRSLKMPPWDLLGCTSVVRMMAIDSVTFFLPLARHVFFFFLSLRQGATAIDLDDLFNDIYYTEFEPTPVTSTSGGGDVKITSPATVDEIKKRKADAAGLKSPGERDGGDAAAGGGLKSGDASTSSKDLTEQQKIERRERNREHAKRSRLRKKFLLESLQEQIHELEDQMDKLKDAIKTELPDKAAEIIGRCCGDKEKYTPLPMPSGFGPVKTLLEPDFRLMSALSGSQQNFAISDPTLPDNPIVYVSQGFLDLTGYTLDQVLGRNCRFLQGPGTDQKAVEVIRKGIAEGVDTSVCLLNYKADGTPFWNQFFVAALRDAENNVVNYVGVQCEVSKAVVEKHMGMAKENDTAT